MFVGKERCSMQAVLGIDVSKATVDVALFLPETKNETKQMTATFENTKKGFKRLQQWLIRQNKQPLHACLEATGRYGEAIAEYLFACGYQVSVVNPSRIYAYSRSKLRRSKTDKSDALLIADFCLTQHPPLWSPSTEHQQELQELSRQLDDLKTSRQRVSNRLGSGIRSKTVKKLLQEQLDLLDGQVRHLEEEIEKHIADDEQTQSSFELLLSIPGIGPVTAAKFLAEVPDIRLFESADQLAAYAGLVPRHHLSGSSVRGRSTLAKTGNAFLRTAFYMPALSAERFNPLIANLAQRLRSASIPKSRMTIVAAIMHKLLVLSYGVLKSARPFDPNFAISRQLPT
jgi:transposase